MGSVRAFINRHSPSSKSKGQAFLRQTSTWTDPAMTALPWYLLPADGPIRKYWDFWSIACLLYVGVMVPYRIGFDVDTPGALQPLETMIDVTFILDVPLTFLTAPRAKTGEYTTHLPTIARQYLQSWFLVDVASSLPLGLILGENSLNGLNQVGRLVKLPRIFKVVRFLRLMRFARIGAVQRTVDWVESSYNIHQGVSRLASIAFWMLFVSHLVGCVWHLLAVGEDGQYLAKSWVVKHGIEHGTDGEKYVAALYWTVTTLATVGYGDINAFLWQEKLFAIVVMLIGVTWFSYIVSSMSAIMSSFDAKNAEARQKMQQVTDFIRDAHLPHALASKVRNHFEYLVYQQYRKYKAEEILAELSSALRTEIVLYIDKELIAKIPFFKQKIPHCIASMVVVLQPMVSHKGEFICLEGAYADEMYFLTKGQVTIVKSERQIKILNPGDYFGEIGCLLTPCRNASVVVLSPNCELYVLSKKHLLQFTVDFPEIYDELATVARNRLENLQRYDKRRDVQLVSTPKDKRYRLFELVTQYQKQAEIKKGKTRRASIANVGSHSMGEGSGAGGDRAKEGQVKEGQTKGGETSRTTDGDPRRSPSPKGHIDVQQLL